MKRIIPLLLLIILSIGAKAQFSLAVQGTVSTNNSTASVAGVLVEIYYDSVPGAIFPGPFFTHTNANGFYSDTIPGIPNGLLKVKVMDCNGSYLTQQRVVLPNVPVATVDFSNYCATQTFGCNPAFTAQTNPANPFLVSFLLNQGAVSPTTTLIWSFGDGNSQTTVGSPVISHAYGNAGNYRVSVLMIDSLHGCSAIFSDSVRVWMQGGGSLCHATFNAGQFPLPNAFHNIRFHINSFSSPNGIMRLDFGDGTFITGQVGSIPFADHVYATPGVYVPCISIIDTSIQCNSNHCDTLIVNSTGQGNCHASFLPTYTPGNAPVSVTFHNQSSGSNGVPFGFSSQWSFGDGTFSSASNPTHVYTANGAYLVTLTIFDSLNNCTNTYSDSIYIGSSNLNCAASFVHTVLAQQGGGIVSFIHQTNAPGPHHYSWDFGNGQTVNHDHPVTFLPNGAYRVCFTIVSLSNGCTATYCDSVFVGNNTSNCQASFTSTVPSGNAPVTVNFTNTSTGTAVNTMYHWDFGDGTTGVGFWQNHIYSANGTYMVTLSMFDTSQSCHSVFVDTIVVGTAPQNCQAFYTINSNPSNPTQVTFNNQSTSNVSTGVWYQWNFGDGSPIVALANPTHTYTNPGTYNVCLTINSPNCTDTYCTTVTIGQTVNTFSLGGAINGPTAGVGNVVNVYLFEVQSNGAWIPTDTVTAIDTAGFLYYNFSSIPTATYAVLAELTPNSPQGSMFFATYIGNTVSWNNAVLVFLNNQTSMIPWNINMVSFLSLPSGTGSISGNVLRGNLRVASGNMPNVTVQLLDPSLLPIMTSRTDAQGQFNFSDLPMGTYNIHIDWPGRPCTPIPVTLMASQNNVNGINFTMNRGSIVTATQEVFSGNVDKIYPNPVRDQLFVELNLTNDGVYMLEVYNLSGQKVSTETRSLIRGSQRLEIPTQDLSSGLYLMRLTDPSGAATQWKVSKQ